MNTSPFPILLPILLRRSRHPPNHLLNSIPSQSCLLNKKGTPPRPMATRKTRKKGKAANKVKRAMTVMMAVMTVRKKRILERRSQATASQEMIKWMTSRMAKEAMAREKSPETSQVTSTMAAMEAMRAAATMTTTAAKTATRKTLMAKRVATSTMVAKATTTRAATPAPAQTTSKDLERKQWLMAI